MSDNQSWLAVARAHPVIVGINGLCVVCGIVGVIIMAPEDWSLLRSLAAGAMSGGFIGLCITAPRIVGQ